MAIEYQKGSSTLHRLDARTKVLLFLGLTVLAVIVIDPIMIAAMFLILYGFGARAVERKMLNRNLRVLVVIFSTFSIFQILFFTPRDAHFLFFLIPGTELVPVTVEGIIRGIGVFFRFFIVVLSVHLMLYTTPPVDLVLALTRRERRRDLAQMSIVIFLLGAFFFGIAHLVFFDQIAGLQMQIALREAALALGAFSIGFVVFRTATRGLPPEMSLALSIGFATVGILSQQTQKITEAQQARGYDVQPKNLARRVQVLTALMLPIFLATLERSQDIAIAILARAFDYNIAKRTYRRELKFGTNDYVLIGLIAALLLGSLTIDLLGLASPTEQTILRLLNA
jgi:energy-coupling factor transporter transmembrane protein EcfT